MGKIDHPTLDIGIVEKAIKPEIMKTPIRSNRVTHPTINARINAPIVKPLSITFGYRLELNHGENSEGFEAEMKSP